MRKKILIFFITIIINCSILDKANICFSYEIETTYIYYTCNSKLDRGKWSRDTYNSLQRLINRVGVKSSSYNENKKPYAVFDWDETCIYMNTERIVFRYQIENLAFKMTPKEFSKVIRMSMLKDNFSKKYTNKNGEALNIEKIAEDIDYDYTYLYKHYKGFKGNQSLEQLRDSEYFIDFRAKLYFLYEALNNSFHPDISQPWVLYMFTNMTSKEVMNLAEKAFDLGLGDKIEKRTWISSELLPGRAGVVSINFISGLRIHTEAANLMHVLKDNGIDVYICSATFNDIIKKIALEPKYGYNLSEDVLICMNLNIDKKSRYKAECKKNYPITYGAGKTTAIKNILVKKYGYGPVLVCGDSNNDVNMMQDFDDVQLVLIINRLMDTGTPIGKLSKKAVHSIGSPNAKYVLQGVNENVGLYRPCEKTIKFGKTEKEEQLLQYK